ncbi:transcriptional regulator [Dictyobacter aurantiacus]|uniref:Transcriptional regulator n=2 Tax=Dictyobacter aurantiacus TaxID=1936993 RepID=A0A401ZK27_9CHLR|nr:transcriptional regulator [Dictyobacter aurantiacus]
MAARLRVSERTLYRDINDLSLAGVPIYGEAGPGGGYALLPGYRLEMAGLNETELSTLFISEGRGPLGDLDLHTTREVALSKVLSTLSERDRRRAAELQELLHVDPTGWNFPADQVPFLRAVQDAVWQQRRVSLTYRRENGAILTPMVNPLGLVVKAGTWYLVGDTGETIRPFRIARIQRIEALQETFKRPEGFQLARYWGEWCARFFPSYPVTLQVAPKGIPRLMQIFGESISDDLLSAQPDHTGWRTISLVFETMETARAALLDLGPTAEVLEPVELRESVIAWAQALLSRYGDTKNDPWIRSS